MPDEIEEPVDDQGPRYSLLMLSTIPVVEGSNGFESLDLWVVDLAAQIRHTKRFCLICPVVRHTPHGWQGSARLPEGIEIVASESLNSRAVITKLLRQFDVVQVNAGQSWRESRLARRIVALAREAGVASIVGISSDRAKTTLLNSKPRTPRQLPAAAKSLLRYVSLRATYARLTAAANGTFVVGAGLRSLVSKQSRTVHVGTASWIKAADLRAARSKYRLDDVDRSVRVCIAARLERMKGVHIGIEAFIRISAHPSLRDARLVVYGAGTERGHLEALVERSHLSGHVTFGGTLSYPDEFLAALERFGIVMLTNLNVEQPRLIFDAISRGCIPICPDNVVYRSLGLPADVLYKIGDSQDLANVLTRFLLKQFDRELLVERLLDVGRRFTLESMHRLRAEWIAEMLSRQPER